MSSYESFNDETKYFLNMAMNIYHTIKDFHIHKSKILSLDSDEYIDYTLSNLDKKIVSLYMAGLLGNDCLSKILVDYDDLRVDDFFSFINLDSEGIKLLNVDDYGDFYNQNFKLELISLMNEKSKYYVFNKITPEVIFVCLRGANVNGSEVLNYFGSIYKVQVSYFADHPSFKAIENDAIERGVLQKKKFDSRSNSVVYFDCVDLEFDDEINDSCKDSFDLNASEVWLILDGIKKKFVGQECAVEYLFYNIINNQYLALRDDVNDGERSIVFLDGPTGTGKTAITREITEKLGIACTSASIINFSAAGYVGGDIQDVLVDLYNKANRNLSLAEKGIVIFDEFDKLAYNIYGNGLDMKKNVQQQLLDFMGGGKYKITVGSNLFFSNEVLFDTSKLTFICLGALTDLRTLKTEKKAALGFNASVDEFKYYSIRPNDLIDLGLERELVGRFNTYIHTEEYSKESLLAILMNSEISPFIGFKKWVNANGKSLVIGENVYETIASLAYDLNMGARSLQTVMNNIRTYFLKDVLRGKVDCIYLDANTILSINDRLVNRKARV